MCVYLLKSTGDGLVRQKIADQLTRIVDDPETNVTASPSLGEEANAFPQRPDDGCRHDAHWNDQSGDDDQTDKHRAVRP